MDLLLAVFTLPYPRRFVVLACAMPYWIWIADFTLGSLSRGMRASSWHHDGFEPFALVSLISLGYSMSSVKLTSCFAYENIMMMSRLMA